MRASLRVVGAGFFLLIALLAAVGWATSRPFPFTWRIYRQPDCAYFIGSDRGNLRVWSQLIVPPPPADVTVTLDVPGRLTVRGRDGAHIDAALSHDSEPLGSHEYRVGTATFY